MSENPTKNLPGDSEEFSVKQDDDRINVLIIAVQSLGTAFHSLSADFQALSADFQEVKSRLTALEKTVQDRSYETKPIWERALAEIAATRSELAEVRAEVKELRTELNGMRTELNEMRTELKETKTELRAEMKDGFRKLASKMGVLNDDLLTLRGDQHLLDKRVEDLESKAS